MGWRNWFEAERPDFDKTDEDSNGRLSEDELHEVVNAADLMGGWQGADDGYLTPQEFDAGLKAAGDADENGSIDKVEYSHTLAAITVKGGEQTSSRSADAGQPPDAVGNQAVGGGDRRDRHARDHAGEGDQGMLDGIAAQYRDRPVLAHSPVRQ